MFTPTTRGVRRAATITMGLALLAVPALATGQAQAPTSAETTFEAAETLDASSAATAVASDAAAPVDRTAATSAASTQQATAGDVEREVASRAATAPADVAAAADESGSTETRTVQRACNAEEDPHYVPASGRDADECHVDGTFDPSRSYTATHYTNDVRCGGDNVLVPVDAAGAYVSGDGGGSADGGSGHLQACSDDALPIHGRATTRGDVDSGGDFTASATADGDRDNPEETSQGWATVTLTPAGPERRCGKAYAEGGRADSDNPTSEDTADQCG